MDSTLKDTLTANLKAARSPEERDNAPTLAMIAMIDCQYKTAQRVKALMWKVIALSLGAGGGVGAIATQLDWLKRFFANFNPTRTSAHQSFATKERRKPMMNWLVKWGIKKYVLGIVNTTLDTYSEAIGRRRAIVAGYIRKVQALLDFLQSLDEKIADGNITEADAEIITDEAAALGNALVA